MDQVGTSAPAALEQLTILNSTGVEYPRDKTIAELFEEVASLRPHSVALSFEDEKVTYSELNAGANKVARRLRQLGVGPEVIVGCCIERSIELIVALIGISKAGGAYLPLDSAYPKERLKSFIEDTRADVVLTSKTTATVLADLCPNSRLLDVTELLGSTLDINDSAAVRSPQTLAYVMYTSGSTGSPKGVMVENRAVVRLVRNSNFCEIGPDDVFLQFAPISFDASTFEIWGALLNGARLVIVPPRRGSLADLGQIIRDQHITVLWLTSGLFNLMVEEQLDDLSGVRQVLAGGDVLSVRHVRLLLGAAREGCRLINGYGPTENTTFTCCHVMTAGDIIPDSVPIGRPISNTQVLILDEHLHSVAPGETGELCAAGDGLARGYWNDREATEEKFVLDPFSGDRERRIYRTGDLARIGRSGVIEFLGRIDDQIKIRGHRVEPREIEVALEACQVATQSCVISSKDEFGSNYLIAYYVPSDRALETSAVRERLSAMLPDYLIPAVFVSLDSLPLTANGKIDRSALPRPASNARNGGMEAAEATELEQTIIDVWRDVLKVDWISPKSNFFDLGGNSLLLLVVHANLQKKISVLIPIMTLFEFTTPQSLAQHLSGAAGSSVTGSQQRARKQRAAFARQRQRRVESRT